jgi:hypothetical protein
MRQSLEMNPDETTAIDALTHIGIQYIQAWRTGASLRPVFIAA